MDKRNVTVPQKDTAKFKGKKAISLSGEPKKVEDTELLSALSGFFKIFSDNTRLKIIFALTDRSLCVSELAELIGYGLSVISHQLNILKSANVIKSERKGKKIYYSIVDCHVKEIVEMAVTHIEEK